MTTVVIDVKRKLMVSDSRATICKGGTLVKYLKDSKKLFMSHESKFCAAVSGNATLTLRTLSKLGVPFSRLTGEVLKYKCSKGSSGDILLMNKYNNQVCHIHIEQGILFPKRTIEYYTRCAYLTMGSGGTIAGDVFSKTKDAKRAVRLAGLIDRGTDTKLQIIQL